MGGPGRREWSMRPRALVAGGGPAGLMAARRLAEAGIDVVLFEKSSEIGMPVHTSGASWVRDMRAFGVPESLYTPVSRLRFAAPSAEARFSWPEAVGCILDVRRLYQHLAERAVQAGAELHVRSAVTRPVIRGGRVTGLRVKTVGRPEREFAAELVVDATGFVARVGRDAGLHNGFTRYGLGAEYELFAPHADHDEVMIWVGSDGAPAGYGWLAPCCGSRFRLGVGVIRPDVPADPLEYLNRAMEGHPALRSALRGASPIEFHLGYIPAQGMACRWVGDGVVCVGDAAGHPSPLLGEGIRFAMHSGSMAGEIAARALLEGNVSAHRLAEFPARWNRQFGRLLRRTLRLNRFLTTLSDRGWDLGVEMLATLDPPAAEALLRGRLRPIATATWRSLHSPRLARAVLWATPLGGCSPVATACECRERWSMPRDRGLVATRSARLEPPRLDRSVSPRARPRAYETRRTAHCAQQLHAGRPARKPLRPCHRAARRALPDIHRRALHLAAQPGADADADGEREQQREGHRAQDAAGAAHANGSRRSSRAARRKRCSRRVRSGSAAPRRGHSSSRRTMPSKKRTSPTRSASRIVSATIRGAPPRSLMLW